MKKKQPYGQGLKDLDLMYGKRDVRIVTNYSNEQLQELKGDFSGLIINEHRQ